MTLSLHTVNVMSYGCAAKLVSAFDLSGLVHWANWHRKDPDHIRQASQEHACWIHHSLPNVLCSHLLQPDSRLYRQQTRQKVLPLSLSLISLLLIDFFSLYILLDFFVFTHILHADVKVCLGLLWENILFSSLMIWTCPCWKHMELSLPLNCCASGWITVAGMTGNK